MAHSGNEGIQNVHAWRRADQTVIDDAVVVTIDICHAHNDAHRTSMLEDKVKFQEKLFRSIEEIFD